MSNYADVVIDNIFGFSDIKHNIEGFHNLILLVIIYSFPASFDLTRVIKNMRKASDSNTFRKTLLHDYKLGGVIP